MANKFMDTMEKSGDQARMQLLVDAITDYAIYMLDPSGIVTSWNAGAQRFKGYQAHEILGSHFSRFYPDEDRADGLPERALATARTEGRFEHEGWRQRKDGSRFWANVVIDPIWDPTTGALAGFAKITRDITEKRQAEETLRRSEERFRILVQGVTDYAIYMLDPDGRVSNWNKGAERIKGYSEAEIVGEHFSRFYLPEEQDAGMPALALATASREGSYEKESWRLRKDGTPFWAHVIIDPIHGPDGDLIGYAKITRDLSERKAAQEALEKAREALFHSQKMEAIGQLTGGIAHDFNNLLTVIVNGLDLITRNVRDHKEVRIVESMQRAAERGKNLNQQLLAFARKQPLKPEVANPNSVISGFEAVLRRACGEAVQFNIRLAPRIGSVMLDTPQFEAALLNLVVNARDAMPNGGKLEMSTESVSVLGERAALLGVLPGNYLCVSVRDTGVGIPEDIRSRVLEPFFTTKEVGKGTGLGLSQVYGFVTQSKGAVEIKSEIDEGTTIHLLLPAAESDDSASEDEGERDREVRSTNGTVLIVEDEPDVLEVAVQIFESLGYNALSASNAAAALEVLEREEKVDVLFSDVIMPGAMNGVELAREAVKMRPGMKVLLASGYPMSALSDLPPEEEVSFISKPYRWSELDARLRDLRVGQH